jgi:hypothetical protein
VQPQKPISSWIEVLDSERVFAYARCASNVRDEDPSLPGTGTVASFELRDQHSAG